MKNFLQLSLILVICSIFFTQFLTAQILPAGGGEFISQQREACLSDSDRKDIKQKIEDNTKELISKGILSADHSKPAAVSFEWPLRKAAGFPFYDYYATTNFVDHDPAATGAQYGASNEDYNCGNRTYDATNGYNHQGTDYILWPYPWYLFENNLVEVIAAAPGIIIGKGDGNDDDHCSCFGDWNAVYVQHSDGSIAWYGHLKKNTLTTKDVGQSVAAGEYIGVVGSSGCSTTAHLHFEVYDNTGNLIDPYAGPCNSMNSVSWWQNQRPYREPTLNALLTHNAPPNPGCPTANEEPNLENSFSPGQAIYFASYYHDQTAGDAINHRIKRPDNTVWYSWNQTAPSTYEASWWYYTYTLPTTEQSGTWTYEIDYYGQTYSHNFEYVSSYCTNPGNNTWTGPNNGNWHSSNTNWSRGQIPQDCDNVVIPANLTVNITGTNNGECNTIEVASGAELKVETTANLNVNLP